MIPICDAIIVLTIDYLMVFSWLEIAVFSENMKV